MFAPSLCPQIRHGRHIGLPASAYGDCLASQVRNVFGPGVDSSWAEPLARKLVYFLSSFSNLDLVDRERLSCCPMTLVRKHDEVHQRGQERLEPVVILLGEAGIEEGLDAADDARGGDCRRGLGWEELPGLLVEA